MQDREETAETGSGPDHARDPRPLYLYGLLVGIGTIRAIGTPLTGEASSQLAAENFVRPRRGIQYRHGPAP